jgi:hypothetical protein
LPQATGTWDWVYRSNDEHGNLRVEQEEWHLVQQGTAIEGYYDRALTLLSLDDQLFRCNQQLGITKFTRVRVTGSVEGKRVRVHEVSFDARPGPCDDGARSLNHYEGELETSTLRLEYAERAGEQTLLRRPREGGQRLAEMVGLEDRPAGMPTDPSPGPFGDRRRERPVQGVFTWDLHAIDADGDDRVEHEEWHLDERGGEIRGFYERRVVRVRDGATFKCNGLGRYETRVRFELAGHRTGDSLVLSETGFKAENNPCDNGRRRLDTYQGSISDGGEELVLSWGSGNQVLRRQRGPAPSTLAE